MTPLKFIKTYTDFNAVGTLNQVLVTAPPDISITGSFIEIVTPFTMTDPAMTWMQSSTLNAFTDATTTVIPNDGNNPADTLKAEPSNTTTDIPVTLNGDGDLSTLTAGEMHIHFYCEDNS